MKSVQDQIEEHYLLYGTCLRRLSLFIVPQCQNLIGKTNPVEISIFKKKYSPAQAVRVKLVQHLVNKMSADDYGQPHGYRLPSI